MTRDPLTTTPDAPIESAARLMRDHKIGALPVVSQHFLVGLITESDIFRALLEVFEAPDRAVRVTFSLSPGEDVLPLVAEIARRRCMRVTSSWRCRVTIRRCAWCNSRAHRWRRRSMTSGSRSIA